MITIHNLRKERPSTSWDFRVDRTTPFGNPYLMTKESQRDRVCDLYEKNFEKIIKPEWFKPLIDVYKVYGKLRLFCWCAPKRCHAETIRRYIALAIEKESSHE